jgi:hypothetical protein
MEINIHQFNNVNVAEIRSERIVINEVQDALDLMADCGYRGANSMIIHEKNLVPEFFELKTRIAGEILQKFSNYRVRLAIVGDFSKYTSKSLRDFIFESNKQGRVIFTGSVEEALEKLTK